MFEGVNVRPRTKNVHANLFSETEYDFRLTIVTIAIAVRTRASTTVAIAFIGTTHAAIARDAIAFGGVCESETRQRNLGRKVRFVNPIDDRRIIHVRRQSTVLYSTQRKVYLSLSNSSNLIRIRLRITRACCSSSKSYREHLAALKTKQ